MSLATPADILEYWFGDTGDWLAVTERNGPRWFQRGHELDAEIASRFGDTVAAARAGELDARRSPAWR
jgi:uncharacterized protein (DUF924 family)